MFPTAAAVSSPANGVLSLPPPFVSARGRPFAPNLRSRVHGRPTPSHLPPRRIALCVRAAAGRNKSLIPAHGYDSYELLGLELTASQADIKSAYRRLQKRCHPDVAGPAAATFTAQHILQAALEHGASTAIVDPTGVAHSYDTLFAAASAAAAAFGDLPSSVGGGPDAPPCLPPGSRIGLFSSPGLQFVAALWGTWLAGHVAVPLCTSHPAAELLYVLQNSEASAVVGPAEARQLLHPIADELGIPFLVYQPVGEPTSATVVGGKADVAERLLRQQLQDSQKGALFIYTSGTTGRPKGVVHSHAGLGVQAQMLVEAWEYSPQDRFLHVLPLHHVHGVMNALLAPLSAGATVHFMPKFSPATMWARLRQSYPAGSPAAADAITVFTGVPTHYVRLIQAYDSMTPEEQSASASSASKLRLMMSGSAACPEPVMLRWQEITGQRLLERYGMTEFAMGLSNPLHGDRKLGYVGFPLRGVQTKILYTEEEDSGSGSDSDSDSGSRSGSGSAEGGRGGELLVRSPGMFREYWNRPEANAEAFDEDGFFRTGDTVTRDEEGYFKILGRTSVDIIKSGGYKLSALEIEALLLEHPRIGECAVLGVPDSDYGEAVAAVLTSAQGEAVPELRELKKWCRERMAHYKIPTKIRVIDAMPRNAMGKINKKELRKQLFT